MTEPIAHDYLVDDYRADVRPWDVRGAVHIDAGAEAPQALDETRWLETVSARTGLPSAIVAFAPLDDPGVKRLLEAQAAQPLVRGIRHTVNWHANRRAPTCPAISRRTRPGRPVSSCSANTGCPSISNAWPSLGIGDRSLRVYDVAEPRET